MKSLAIALASAASLSAQILYYPILNTSYKTISLSSRETIVTQQIQSYNADLASSDRTAKYCKMGVSPFVFYRGTNHLFWMDLAGDSRLDTYGDTSGYDATQTWIQGDMHIENFGAFHNDDNTVIYDINDFDEAIVADYQYDVWRLAISLVLVMNEKGYTSSSFQDDVLEAFSESYLDAIEDYVGNTDEVNKKFTESNTGGSYSRLDNFLEDVEDKDGGTYTAREEMLNEWTDVSGSTRRFDLGHEDLESIASSVRTEIQNHFTSYRYTTDNYYRSSYFTIKDMAKRINAGTGSLGTPRYYVLVEGAGSGESDDVILDIKLQSKPTPYTYLDSTTQSWYDSNFEAMMHDAYRHQVAYEAMGDEVDNYMGYIEINGDYYSVRERSPYKATFDTDELTSRNRFKKMAKYWGEILATAHSRADDDYDASYVPYSFESNVKDLIDGHHNDFNDLVNEVAKSYADQVETDYGYFLDNFDLSSCD